MKSIGPYDGDFRLIKAQDINVDHEYQRGGDTQEEYANVQAHAARIARCFSWRHFDPVRVVERRAGRKVTYFTPDGQTRVLAVMMLDPTALVPCIVYQSADVATEVSDFLAHNSNRRPVTGFQRHRARRRANDPTVLAIDETLREYGLSLTSGVARRLTDGTYGLTCYRSLAESFSDMATLRATLTVLTALRDPVVPWHDGKFVGLCRRIAVGIDVDEFLLTCQRVGSTTLAEDLWDSARAHNIGNNPNRAAFNDFKRKYLAHRRARLAA